jgi:homoserine O-acetyltransferase
MNHQTYSLGDIKLISNEIFYDAQISYQTYGKLNEARDNVILYPTWYSGFISDNEWLIGEDKALNPKKYFIIVVCLFGNGQSSSPSHSKDYKNLTLYDNVIQQHRLLTEKLEIKKIKLIVGWSMGAQQCFQWACLFPDMVERIVPFCGSSKTSPHNFVFLESLRYLLSEIGDSEQNIKCFARIYAGWGFSQPFYKQERWKQLGFTSLEDFLVGFWEAFFLKRDPRNLLALIWTWQNGDISKNPKFNGNWIQALESIQAKVLILSPEIDLYFPKEDNFEEAKYIKNCKVEIIKGVWGHFSGGGIHMEDTLFIDDQIKKFLESDI